MITAGIDVGAKTVKVVILKDGAVIGKAMDLMEMDRKKSVKDAFDKAVAGCGISKKDIHSIVATGTGQKSADFANSTLTTVTCDSRGIVALAPSVRTVIDVGANDAMVVKCDEAGKVVDFAKNEKCAAGAGAFVEAMSRAMQVSLEEFVALSLQSDKTVPINAQCAVFAESEVVSLVHQKTERKDICRSVHDAMAGRIASMVKRVKLERDIAVIGGVAHNAGMLDSLKRDLKEDFVKIEEPEYVGAFGAALLAAEAEK